MAGMRVERLERLDHLGIVACVCQEIELAAYLDTLAGPSQQQVSVGTDRHQRVLLRRTQEWDARSCLVPQVLDAFGPMLVVAPGDVADPIRGIAGDAGNQCGSQPAC